MNSKGFYIPGDAGRWAVGSSNTTSPTLGALNDKIVQMGFVDFEGSGSKNISKIHRRVAGSTMVGTRRVSVQGQDASNGPPGRNDGTIKGATNNALFSQVTLSGTPTANAWVTDTLTEVAPVVQGQKIAIVDEATLYTSGSLAFTFNNGGEGRGSGFVQKNNVLQSNCGPNVVLEFDDGTFGTLSGAQIFNTTSSTSYNSGSATKTRALKYTPTFTHKCDGVYASITPAAACDFDVVIYEGTTELVRASVLYKQLFGTTNDIWAEILFPPVTLTSGHTYYIALVPKTANNLQLYHYTVSAAAHLALNGAGSGDCQSTNANEPASGAWTDTVTSRPQISVRVVPSSIGLGGGSAGALVGGGLVT